MQIVTRPGLVFLGIQFWRYIHTQVHVPTYLPTSLPSYSVGLKEAKSGFYVLELEIGLLICSGIGFCFMGWGGLLKEPIGI